MAVRLPSHERYEAQVDKEQRWLPVLAPLLPLDIPVPLARGVPGAGYPWRWSVYEWIEGEAASAARLPDLESVATALARFLRALRRIDAADGPPPGPHNFFRGGPLTVYDGETRNAIAALGRRVDAEEALAVWETALRIGWSGASVWLHGDVSASNLLVRDGKLSAVIDFGCSGVGDPACDFTIAWTFFSGASRESFRACSALDEGTWARARGWALWKALITLAAQPGPKEAQPTETRPPEAQRVVDELIAEQQAR